MKDMGLLFVRLLLSALRRRGLIQVEKLALRNQFCVHGSGVKYARIKPVDRIFRSIVARRWTYGKDTVIFVGPETIDDEFNEYWHRVAPALSLHSDLIYY